ncbi:MAG: hypothetical protein ACOY45_09615 [Pseudomonadota bacterium]
MSAARDAVERAIAALTYASVTQIEPITGRELAVDAEVPLLDRSIGRDLRSIETFLGRDAKGRTLLSANAAAIDEALLALAEAREAMR